MRRLTASASWTVGAFVIASLAAVVLAALVARLEGPVALGRYTYMAWVLRDLAVLATLGLPTAQTRLVAEALATDDHVTARGVLRLGLRLHMLLLVVLVPVVGLVMWRYEGSAVLAVAVAVGFAAVVGFSDIEAYLMGARRFRALAGMAGVMAAVQLALAAVAIWRGLGWQTLVACQSAGVVAGAVGGALLIGRRRAPARVLSPAVRASFLHYGAIALVGLVANAVVWGRPELFFLERSGDAMDLGHYAAALRLAGLSTMVPLMATQALLPELSSLRGEGRDDELAKIFPRIVTMVCLAAVPLSIGVMGLAPELLDVVFGTGFAAAGPAAALLLGATSLAAFRGVATAAILTGRRPRFGAELAVVAIIVNLVLDVVLIGAFGLMGAAVATTLAQAGWVAAAFVHLHGQGLRVPGAGIARCVVAGAGMAVVGYALTQVFQGPFAVVIAGGLAFAVYVVAVIGLGVVRLEDLGTLVGGRRALATR